MMTVVIIIIIVIKCNSSNNSYTCIKTRENVKRNNVVSLLMNGKLIS